MNTFSKIVCGLTAACALFSCSRQETDLVNNGDLSFIASVGSYQTKATDTAFETGDAVGLSAGAPLNLTNVKLTWDGNALKANQPLSWGDVDPDTKVTFAAYYPYQESVDAGKFLSFQVKADQSTHALFTASDLMGALTESAPADGPVKLNFLHQLTKVVFTVENRTNSVIEEVYVGNVFGQVDFSSENGIVVTGTPGTIKAGKATMSGEEVWAVIVAPALSEPTIMVTTADKKQYTYKINKAVEFQSGCRYSAKIILDQDAIYTEFTSEVTDWTDNGDLQFNQGVHKLNWTVKYQGCQWPEDDFTDGQKEFFEVSNTNTSLFYTYRLFDEEDGDVTDYFTDEVFAKYQESLESTFEFYSYFYGYTREQLIPLLFYNETVTGTILELDGLDAGKYQLAILSINADGYYDKGYKIISFEKDTDALEIYPWYDSYTLNSEWAVQWNDWVVGREGIYYKVKGQAAGADYVFVTSYTDEEMEDYFGGNVADLYNTYQSEVKSSLANGSTMESLVEKGLLFKTASGGAFDAVLNSWEEYGPINVYIIAFDAQGNILPSYGVSVVDVPEYVEPELEMVLQENWSVTISGEAYEKNGSVYVDIVPNVPGIQYYDIEENTDDDLDFYYDGSVAGIAESYSEDYMDYMDDKGYTMDQMAFSLDNPKTSIRIYNPGVESTFYIVEFDEYGKPTGRYGATTLVMPEPEVIPLNWQERTDWAINYDATVDTGYADYPQALVATACDATYFAAAVFAGGSLEKYGLDAIAEAATDDLQYYIGSGYTITQMIGYGYAFDAVPAVMPYSGLENGDEAYIFAVDATGAPTGEWHMETLTGIQEAASAPSAAPAKAARKLAPAKAAKVMEKDRKQVAAKAAAQEKASRHIFTKDNKNTKLPILK